MCYSVSEKIHMLYQKKKGIFQKSFFCYLKYNYLVNLKSYIHHNVFYSPKFQINYWVNSGHCLYKLNLRVMRVVKE